MLELYKKLGLICQLNIYRIQFYLSIIILTILLTGVNSYTIYKQFP